MIYDIVIVSHKKDFNKIKYVVEYAEKNLIDFESIHLILTDNNFDEIEMVQSVTSRPIYIHLEQDVVKLDFQKVNYRPNWIYQILLKMFQNVTKNDNFLILESDGIINKKLNFFKDNKTILYLGRDTYCQSVFTYNEMINIKGRYPYSFISEVMMYNKKYIKEIFKNCGCETKEDFIEKYIYNNLNSGCFPADYELYGNYLYLYHGDDIILEHYNYSLNGLYNNTIYSDDQIKSVIERNKNFDYISFHTWL